MPDSPPTNRIAPLRLILLIGAVSLIIFPWIPGSENFHSNEISLKLMAPICMPIIVMLLLLDAVMLLVYREGSNNVQQRKQWTQLMRWELVCAALLIASWGPFFVRLNS